jgi:hypothetical protein
MNQTPYSLYKEYASILDHYQVKFVNEFGYFPYMTDGLFYKGLTPPQQKLCYAFWTQKEIIIAQTLMELFSDVCDEIESKKID